MNVARASHCVFGDQTPDTPQSRNALESEESSMFDDFELPTGGLL